MMSSGGTGKPAKPKRNCWPDVLVALIGLVLLGALLMGLRRDPPPEAASTPAVRLVLPSARFIDSAAFLKANQAVHLLAYDGQTVLRTAEARVVAVATAVQVDMEPTAAAEFRALLPGGTTVFQYVPLTPTPTLTPTLTLTPTVTSMPTPTLSVRLALPGDRFADGGAFLAADQAIHLLAYDGAEVQLTAEARVVAIATGTPPAVLVDMEPTAAAAFRALLPGGTAVFQYVPLTPTPEGGGD